MGRLRSIAKTLQPSLYRRLPPGQLEVLQQEVGIRVLDWAQVNSQKGPYGAVARSLLTTGPLSRMVQSRAEVLGHVAPRSTLPKVSKGVKGKSNPAGRTYTSRFRGVHQTFPTRRWEAQFRCVGASVCSPWRLGRPERWGSTCAGQSNTHPPPAHPFCLFPCSTATVLF